MSHCEYIDVSVNDNIMKIGMNRPAKKNALTRDMYQAISAAIQNADARDDVKVVVLHGHKTCFTAGNDLADFASRDPNEVSNAIKLLLALHDMKKPLVAAVTGLAVGVGTTLLLHCDIAYAAEDARFRMPFVNLGLCPEAASSLLIPAAIGQRHASELLLFGDFFDSNKAIQAGLINHSMPADELMEFTLQRAAELAAKPSQAIIESKRLMKSHTHDAVGQCLLDEAKIFGQLLASEESKQARESALKR